MKNLFGFPTLGLLIIVGATVAHADTVVPSTAVIYAAGTQSSLAAGAGGTTPVSVTVNGATSYTFSTTGTISLNSGVNNNDADGVNSAVGSSSNTGSGSISGMTGPGAGYLVGVFLGAGGPSGSAPASLDFTTGSGIGFSSLSPLLNQVFFIGDGLTGDGTGTTQTFIVPTGATELYFGISDACNYNGNPSCYGDNTGQFSVAVNAVGNNVVPEPSSLMLFGTGIIGLAGTIRRRFHTA